MIYARVVLIAVLALYFTGCSSASKKTYAASAKSESKPVVSTETPKADIGKKWEQAAANETLIECTRGNEKRSIHIIKEPTRKLSEATVLRVCEVNYVKFGKSERVAEAQRQTEYCVQVGEKIKNNLVGAGFTCK